MDSLSDIVWEEIKDEQLNLKYSRNFLDKDTADELFNILEKELQYYPKELTRFKILGNWQNVHREQVAFGDTGVCYKASGISLPALSWPQYLVDVRDAVIDITGHNFNLLLIDRYRSGYDYLSKHKDDESELDIDAGIVSISLGEVRDIILRHTDHRTGQRKIHPIKISLAHGSLLHMLPPTNKYWYHSLPVRKTAPGVRIVLTFSKVRVLTIE